MINIISSYYNSNNEERQNELEFALNKNCENEIIEKIHLFVDDEIALKQINNFINKTKTKKIKIIEIKKPYYSDLFDYSNTLENKICLIINNDIYLDFIKNDKIFSMLDDKHIFALTRHEYDFSCPLIDNYEGSHDGFMFKSPLKKILNSNIFFKKDIIKMFLNPQIGKDTSEQNIEKYIGFIEEIKNTGLFYQHYLGSENVVISVLYFMGYHISNPCKDIVIIHEHKKNLFDSQLKYIENGIRINKSKYLIKIEPSFSINNQKIFYRNM